MASHPATDDINQQQQCNNNPLFVAGDKVPAVVHFGCVADIYDEDGMKQRPPWQSDLMYEFDVGDIMTPNVNLYFNSLSTCGGWVTLLAVRQDNSAANEFAKVHRMPLLKRTRPAAAELANLTAATLLRSPNAGLPEQQLLNPFLAFDEDDSKWMVTTDVFVDLFYAADVAMDICRQQCERLYATLGMPSDHTKYVYCTALLDMMISKAFQTFLCSFTTLTALH